MPLKRAIILAAFLSAAPTFVQGAALIDLKVANVCLDETHLDDAIAACTKLIGPAASFSEPRLRAAPFFRRAFLYGMKRQCDLAFQDLQEAAHIIPPNDPGYVRVYQRRSDAWLNCLDNQDRALEELNAGIDRFPQDAEIRLAKVLLLTQKKQFD